MPYVDERPCLHRTWHTVGAELSVKAMFPPMRATEDLGSKFQLLIEVLIEGVHFPGLLSWLASVLSTFT